MSRLRLRLYCLASCTFCVNNFSLSLSNCMSFLFSALSSLILFRLRFSFSTYLAMTPYYSLRRVFIRFRDEPAYWPVMLELLLPPDMLLRAE